MMLVVMMMMVVVVVVELILLASSEHNPSSRTFLEFGILRFLLSTLLLLLLDSEKESKAGLEGFLPPLSDHSSRIPSSSSSTWWRLLVFRRERKRSKNEFDFNHFKPGSKLKLIVGLVCRALVVCLYSVRCLDLSCSICRQVVRER